MSLWLKIKSSKIDLYLENFVAALESQDEHVYLCK